MCEELLTFNAWLLSLTKAVLGLCPQQNTWDQGQGVAAGLPTQPLPAAHPGSWCLRCPLRLGRAPVPGDVVRSPFPKEVLVLGPSAPPSGHVARESSVVAMLTVRHAGFCEVSGRGESVWGLRGQLLCLLVE